MKCTSWWVTMKQHSGYRRKTRSRKDQEMSCFGVDIMAGKQPIRSLIVYPQMSLEMKNISVLPMTDTQAKKKTVAIAVNISSAKK